MTSLAAVSNVHGQRWGGLTDHSGCISPPGHHSETSSLHRHILHQSFPLEILTKRPRLFLNKLIFKKNLSSHLKFHRMHFNEVTRRAKKLFNHRLQEIGLFHGLEAGFSKEERCSFITAAVRDPGAHLSLGWTQSLVLVPSCPTNLQQKAPGGISQQSCISRSLQTPGPISAGCLFEPIERRVRVMRQELSELPLTPLSRTASGVKKWLLASL